MMKQQLDLYIRARYPLLWVVTAEEQRAVAIETVMPGLKEMRTWVITLAGIVIVSLVSALIAMVVVK